MVKGVTHRYDCVIHVNCVSQRNTNEINFRCRIDNRYPPGRAALNPPAPM
jgi:hypothetical protein